MPCLIDWEKSKKFYRKRQKENSRQFIEPIETSLPNSAILISAPITKNLISRPAKQHHNVYHVL